jgi:hypothetical protein
MKKLFVAALAAFAPFVHANWEYTRFGMSQQELEAAIRKAGAKVQTTMTGMGTTYVSNGRSYDVEFLTSGHGGPLVQVRLKPVDMKQCAAVRQDLIDRHGPANGTSTTTMQGTVVGNKERWNNVRGSQITLSNAVIGNCWIDYNAAR